MLLLEPNSSRAASGRADSDNAPRFALLQVVCACSRARAIVWATENMRARAGMCARVAASMNACVRECAHACDCVQNLSKSEAVDGFRRVPTWSTGSDSGRRVRLVACRGPPSPSVRCRPRYLRLRRSWNHALGLSVTLSPTAGALGADERRPGRRRRGAAKASAAALLSMSSRPAGQSGLGRPCR